MMSHDAPTESASLPAEALERLESSFDPGAPTEHPGLEVVGFGEISMVFRLLAHPTFVAKRLAGFRGEAEVRAFREVVEAYVAHLRGLGLDVPLERVQGVELAPGHFVVFVVQRAVPSTELGHVVLREGTDAEVAALLDAVLERVGAVVDHNIVDHRDDGPELAVGLDAQLSNWAFGGCGRLRYLDITTPFLRDAGRERLDTRVLLRALPLPVALALSLSGATRSMADRYYAPRSIVCDILANFIKEGRADRLPLGLGRVNAFFSARPELRERPLTESEVTRDYRSDARLWAVLQRMKRPDRFLRRTLLRQRYDHVLMPEIAR